MKVFQLSKYLIQTLIPFFLILMKHAFSYANDLKQLTSLNTEHLNERDPPGYFRLIEESPNGTEIIGVSKYLQQRTFFTSPLMNTFRFSDLKFNFQLLDNHQSWTNYFHLESHTGRLTISHRIDREQLCAKYVQTETQNHLTLNPVYLKKSDMKCVKKLFVLSTTMGPDQRNEPEICKIPVEILIVDINDNSPIWISSHNGHYSSAPSKSPPSLPVIELQLLEVPNDQLNIVHQPSTAILPQAIDLDEGVNGQITYRLESIQSKLPQESLGLDNKIPFILKQTTQGQLELQSTTNLDYEKQKLYEFYLIATDSGFPSRTSTALVKIHIMDVNDESPKFDYAIYYPPNGAISEKTIPGTVILNLSAVDADASAPNNRVRYSMIPGSIASNYFTVQTDGRITLKQWLDYENMDSSSTGYVLPAHSDLNQNLPNLEIEPNRKQFIFQVKSIDSAPAPYEKSGTATVIIPVIDENDEAPVITVRYLGFPEFSRNGENGVVKENSPVPIKVAYIQIRDPDFDGQDQFVCHLSDMQNFSLNPIGSIDSSIGFDFSKSDQPKLSKNDFVLTLLQKPDREQLPFLFVRIKCVDQAGNSNEQTVRLRILDENDEFPKFIRSTFQFSLPENAELMRIHAKPNRNSNNDNDELFQGYRIGRVLANDRDQGDNAQIKYILNSEFVDIVPAKFRPPSDFYNPTTTKDIFTILDWTQKFPPTSSLFRLDSETGILYSLRTFDAENINLFRMQVLATDQPRDASEPKHTGTAMIEVQITNVNDWPPLFYKVNSQNQSKIDMKNLEYTTHYVFRIRENQPIYTMVGHIAALDPDIGIHLENGMKSKETMRSQITFKIANDALTETRQAFSLHASQGILRTSVSLDREKQAVYVFHVIASDSGPGSALSRSATATVTVFVEDENDNEPVFVRPVTSSNSNYVPVKTDSRPGIEMDSKFHPKGETNSAGYLTSDATLRTRSYESKSNIPIIVVHQNPKSDATLQDNNNFESRPLLQLEAIDADAGDNGKITYEISAGNTDSLFVLDPNTGTLSLSPKLSQHKKRPLSTDDRHLASSLTSSHTPKVDRSNMSHIMYMLRFEACDCGQPKRCAVPVWVQMVLELASIPELMNMGDLHPYPQLHPQFNQFNLQNQNQWMHSNVHGIGREAMQSHQITNQVGSANQDTNQLTNPKLSYHNHPNSESIMSLRPDPNMNDPVWAHLKYGSSHSSISTDKEYKQTGDQNSNARRATQLNPNHSAIQTLNSSNVVVSEMVIICLVIIFVVLLGAIVALVYLVRKKAILFTLTTNPKLRNQNDNSHLDNDDCNDTLNSNRIGTMIQNTNHPNSDLNNKLCEYNRKITCQTQSLKENSSLYRIVSGDLNMLTTIPKGMHLKSPDTRIISLSDGLSLDRQGSQPLVRRNSEPRIHHGSSMTRLPNLSESVYVPRGLFRSPNGKFRPDHDYQVLAPLNPGYQFHNPSQQQQQQQPICPTINRCLTPFWESNVQINSPQIDYTNQYHQWSKTMATDFHYPGSMVHVENNSNPIISMNQELNLCKSPTFYETNHPNEQAVHYRGDSLPVYPLVGTPIHSDCLEKRNLVSLVTEPRLPYQEIPFVTATLRRHNRPMDTHHLVQSQIHQGQISNPYLATPDLVNSRFVYPNKTIPSGSDAIFENSNQFFNTIHSNANHLKIITQHHQPKLYESTIKDLDDGLTDRSDVPLFPKSPTSVESHILSDQSSEATTKGNRFLNHFENLNYPITTSTSTLGANNRFKQTMSVNPLVLEESDSSYVQKLISSETDPLENVTQLDPSKTSIDDTQSIHLLSPQLSNSNVSHILTSKKSAYTAFREASFV